MFLPFSKSTCFLFCSALELWKVPWHSLNRNLCRKPLVTSISIIKHTGFSFFLLFFSMANHSELSIYWLFQETVHPKIIFLSPFTLISFSFLGEPFLLMHSVIWHCIICGTFSNKSTVNILIYTPSRRVNSLAFSYR